ncbi:hypothetical protein GCM10012275_50830 [Longimycelium tulufanense]|uniref:Uncharacterized protein n=1 Tax=Longimycelium tulufanense TaxID=907463 RepID=A0A8J3FYQ6_9PSEU|nr:hypothetical protein [Longimycelium tulufanense]GGM73942.1 hypothetical protein GCM10012275_50830 [Longimycelium tulufanense]
MASKYTREKTTGQLVVWTELVQALDQLDAAWRQAREAGPQTRESVQLPGNVAVVLVQAAGRAAGALAGVAEVLAQQGDSGGAFEDLAVAQQQIAEKWPTRKQRLATAST